jgi:hypothetical protein
MARTLARSMRAGVVTVIVKGGAFELNSYRREKPVKAGRLFT